jgi:hypothetical protein
MLVLVTELSLRADLTLSLPSVKVERFLFIDEDLDILAQVP